MGLRRPKQIATGTPFEMVIRGIESQLQQALQWDGNGPSPAAPDPVDEERATAIRNEIERLRHIIVKDPQREASIVQAFQLGKLTGLLGFEDRIGIGENSRVNQRTKLTPEGVKANRRRKTANDAPLIAALREDMQAHPGERNRTETARRLKRKPGNSWRNVNEKALARRIARLPDDSPKQPLAKQ